MKYICTLIVVNDLKRSLDLYQEILGLTIEHDLGENISFTCGLSLHLKKHFESLIDTTISSRNHHSHELYFEEDDIEGVYQKLIIDKYEFVHGIKVQPWQQRVFRFYDMDGHIIEIGEPLEAVVRRLRKDHTDITISEMMGMPFEFVNHVE
ncbi:MAG: VOC family protein [Clostridiales bacterium]|nr:VOC family protein [Clostridiales bacterium]